METLLKKAAVIDFGVSWSKHSLFNKLIVSTIDVEAGKSAAWSWAISITLRNLILCKEEIMKDYQIIDLVVYKDEQEIPEFRFIYHKELRRKYRYDYLIDEFLK